MAAAAMAAALSRCGGAPRGEGGGSGFALLRLLVVGLRDTREGWEGAAACAGGGVPVPFRACLRGVPSGSGVAPPFSQAAAVGRGAVGACPGVGAPSEPLTGRRPALAR